MTGWMNANSRTGATRSFPFGPWGVGLLAAGLGALAGLLIPMAWIDEVSWQLYLDQLIAAARPPLGVTARLVAVALMVLGLGLIGWLAAMLLGVRASAGSASDWKRKSALTNCYAIPVRKARIQKWRFTT